MKKIILTTIILCATTASSLYAQSTIKFSGIPHPLSWVNKPVNYKINSTSIFIEAGEKTDMFRDPNVTYNTDNAPRLSFIADPNFVLTTEIHHGFISKWDGGAIVLEADKMNWIKFCFEKDYTGMHRVVSVVTKNISDDCNSVAISGNDVFYKIAKADNVITLYYSADGKKWFLIRHLQFNTSKPIKLGFLAQSPTGKNCKVAFSNITYSTKKIKDPYTGE
jgi:regulation of enolase protein 1 (concanavalin A-like superfamily)